MHKILIILIMSISIYTVSADVNVSFSDIGYAPKEIDFFYPNGTLYNLNGTLSNESITLNDDYDYHVVIRPKKLEIIENPLGFMSFLENNLGELIVISMVGLSLIIVFGYALIKIWEIVS